MKPAPIIDITARRATAGMRPMRDPVSGWWSVRRHVAGEPILFEARTRMDLEQLVVSAVRQRLHAARREQHTRWQHLVEKLRALRYSMRWCWEEIYATWFKRDTSNSATAISSEPLTKLRRYL